MKSLERHLRREDELVALEEAPRGVHEDLVRDAVRQVLHPRLDVARRDRPLYRHLGENFLT